MDDLLADFLTETQEGLGALDAALVRLERSPDDGATLSEVFRIVHTIKGTCGFLGLTRMEAVAHAGENVLGRYRDGTLRVSQAGISLILAALDCIRAIVLGLEATGSEPAGSDAALIASLNAVASGEDIPVAVLPVPAVAAPAPIAAAKPVTPEVAAAEPAPLPASSIAPPPKSVPVAEAEPFNGGNTPPQTIRVTVEVLEGLMMLVSELVLTRNQLLQLSRNGADSAFAVPLQRLSHITSDLQEG